MKLKAGGVELVIEEDEINGWMTSFVLPVWKEFGCENSLEDAAGEKLFVLFDQARLQRVQIGVRLGQADAGFEPRDGAGAIRKRDRP